MPQLSSETDLNLFLPADEDIYANLLNTETKLPIILQEADRFVQSLVKVRDGRPRDRGVKLSLAREE